MSKRSVLHTPFDFSNTERAGRRRFWKQILPFTTINYKGQKIKFDRKYHTDLADSFKSKAFDQVPIVFATPNNEHNMDVRNFGGDVIDMAVRDDGLWGLVEADRQAAKAIRRNPKLGVSARIVQGVEKADGRNFPRAIQHVLLTMNPRVTGMSPWQTADLSEDADIEVVDLTALEYKEGKNLMAKTTTKTKAPADHKAKAKKATGQTLDLSQLSDEDFEALLDLAEKAGVDLTEGEGEGDDEPDDEDKDDEGNLKVRKKKSRTKITIDNESEDNGEDKDDEDDDDTELSDSDKVVKKSELSQFGQMRVDLAQERWEREADAYRKAGVPSFLLELAEPVLSLPDAAVIDLADDETIDASDTIRKMLEGTKGIVDLTDEEGNAFDLSESDLADADTKALLTEWDETYA